MSRRAVGVVVRDAVVIVAVHNVGAVVVDIRSHVSSKLADCSGRILGSDTLLGSQGSLFHRRRSGASGLVIPRPVGDSPLRLRDGQCGAPWRLPSSV